MVRKEWKEGADAALTHSGLSRVGSSSGGMCMANSRGFAIHRSTESPDKVAPNLFRRRSPQKHTISMLAVILSQKMLMLIFNYKKGFLWVLQL